ncbi:hypothetical protein GGU11DRAFT_793752 [Lentinula aff. detonsa]|nr:hypothetical protein GGU11DRAFT_793752 [Lentinula aff. detonsa]
MAFLSSARLSSSTTLSSSELAVLEVTARNPPPGEAPPMFKGEAIAPWQLIRRMHTARSFWKCIAVNKSEITTGEDVGRSTEDWLIKANCDSKKVGSKISPLNFNNTIWPADTVDVRKEEKVRSFQTFAVFFNVLEEGVTLPLTSIDYRLIRQKIQFDRVSSERLRRT